MIGESLEREYDRCLESERDMKVFRGREYDRCLESLIGERGSMIGV